MTTADDVRIPPLPMIYLDLVLERGRVRNVSDGCRVDILVVNRPFAVVRERTLRFLEGNFEFSGKWLPLYKTHPLGTN